MSQDLDDVLREQNGVPALVSELDPAKTAPMTLIDEIYQVLFVDKLYEEPAAQRCVIPQTNKQARMNGFHGSLPAGDFRLVQLIRENANDERYPLIAEANDAELKTATGYALGRRNVSRSKLKAKAEAAQNA